MDNRYETPSQAKLFAFAPMRPYFTSHLSYFYGNIVRYEFCIIFAVGEIFRISDNDFGFWAILSSLVSVLMGYKGRF